MTFWSRTSAAPTLWQASGFISLEPRFLRTTLPDPPDLPLDIRIRRAVPSDTGSLLLFLTECYKGSDWRLRLDLDNMATYLDDTQVVALIALDFQHNLIASIFSVPVGRVTMSHKADVGRVHAIEGLCVRGTHRHKGLAGMMIAQVDYETTRLFGPLVHLWSRELSSKPVLSTAVNVATYAYILTQRGSPRVPLRELEWSEFAHLWESNCHRFSGIVAVTPSNRREGVRVWEGESHGAVKVVVVADTRRITADGKSIYEVVWCGWRIINVLFPASHGLRFRTLLESVAAEYAREGPGLLFVTSDRTGGGAKKRWEGKGPWVYGSSGVHATYIYNYLPPSFGSCPIHVIREEL